MSELIDVLQSIIAFPVWWSGGFSAAVAIVVICIALGIGTWGMFGAQGGFVTRAFRRQSPLSGVSVAREVSAVISGGVAPLISWAIIAWVSKPQAFLSRRLWTAALGSYLKSF